MSSTESEVENRSNDNDETKLKYCKSPRCKTCLWKQLDQGNIITNRLTGQTYTIDFEASCKTTNIIYLVTCSHPDCMFQYVGHSSKAVNHRLTGHRNNLCSLKGSPPKHVGEHFKKVHSPSNLRIKPIQLLKCSDNARTIEDEWIIKLSSGFPYGLNDRIDSKKIKHADLDILCNRICMYKLFDVVPSLRTQRGGNHNQENVNMEEEPEFSIDGFITENMDPLIFPRNLRSSMNSLKLVNVKKIFLHCINILQNKLETLSPFEVHLYFAIKDLGYFIISRHFKPKQSNNSTNFMVIEFVNKIIETVNIQKILNNEDVKEKLPISDSLRIPNISMKYSNTIRSSITNYKQAVQSNINHEDMVCDCANSPFKDNNHNHVITGNLNIIDNNELQNLLKKGLNYREQQPLSKRKALKTFTAAIDKYIDNINIKLKKTLTFFSEWKSTVMEKIKGKIKNIKTHGFNNILSKPHIQECLKAVQEKYIFVPVDKASNNVSIICKKFYLQVLSNEIQNTPTFSQYNGTEEEVIANHQSIIQNEYNIKIQDQNRSIPYLYWLPKFHKEVVAFRFITAGTKCTTKTLSVNIGIALQTCMKVIRQKSQYDNFYKEMNDYFVIDKTQTASQFLLSNNFCRKKKTVSSYDFQTLYTHIPHQQLNANIKKFVKRAFETKGKEYICVTKRSAFFSTKRHTNFSCFTFNSLLSAISYLINNSFINFKGSIFRQCIGIPMGTNSAPHMANIYLAEYEHKFIRKLENNNKVNELRLLQNIFRFQDDLLVLNDNGYFDTIYHDIYPEVMVLNNTNVSPQKVNFLDITISVYQGKFRYECYDKRNDFNFNVISFPYMCGNLPLVQMHGLFVSQLVRYCYTNSTFNAFVECSKTLYKKLIVQGFQPHRLRKNFDKFCQQHLDTWSKFGHDMFSVKDVICSIN